MGSQFLRFRFHADKAIESWAEFEGKIEHMRPQMEREVEQLSTRIDNICHKIDRLDLAWTVRAAQLRARKGHPPNTPHIVFTTPHIWNAQVLQKAKEEQRLAAIREEHKQIVSSTVCARA